MYKYKYVNYIITKQILLYHYYVSPHSNWHRYIDKPDVIAEENDNLCITYI